MKFDENARYLANRVGIPYGDNRGTRLPHGIMVFEEDGNEILGYMRAPWSNALEERIHMYAKDHGIPVSDNHLSHIRLNSMDAPATYFDINPEENSIDIVVRLSGAAHYDATVRHLKAFYSMTKPI